MPPKTKRQIVASHNYRKWKDRTDVRDEARVTGESHSNHTGAGDSLMTYESRILGEWTNEEAEIPEGLTSE